MSRCLACSQENCGYTRNCDCDCHGPNPHKGLKIPEGWTFERLKPEDLEQVLLQSVPVPGEHVGYMATIDFARRLFRSGLVMHGSGVAEYAKKKYTGRGWKQKLVDDAVEWLRSLENSRGRRGRRR